MNYINHPQIDCVLSYGFIWIHYLLYFGAKKVFSSCKVFFGSCCKRDSSCNHCTFCAIVVWNIQQSKHQRTSSCLIPFLSGTSCFIVLFRVGSIFLDRNNECTCSSKYPAFPQSTVLSLIISMWLPKNYKIHKFNTLTSFRI